MRKFLTVIITLILACSALLGCGDQEAPPDDSSGNLPPSVDEQGYTYVDAVKKYEGTEILYYNGVDSYINKEAYGAFSDSDTGSELPEGKDWSEVLGFVHAGGQYNFTSLPYLNEGLGVATQDLKSKTYKMWLTAEMADQYSYNHDWNGAQGFKGGTPKSIVDVAKTEYVDSVFKSSVKNHILVTYEFNKVKWDSTSAISSTQTAYVEKEFYDLTKYLMTTYDGRGKTFVLQNWEGDNELTPALKKLDSSNQMTVEKQKVVNNYIAYSNARQAGIAKARRETAGVDVKVYGALEINFISSNYGKQPKLIDYVVPSSTADLFSFSDWSTANINLSRDLTTLKDAAPNNNDDFGDNNFYLGEYGRAENLNGSSEAKIQFSSSIETMKIALNEGAQFVCYWATMCNERVGGTTSRPVNEDMKGFWLIRPDGHFTDMFWYYKGLIENKDYLTDKPKLRLRLPEPEPDPIPFVEEDIIFQDDFDDKDKDGNYVISRNTKMSGYSENMQYDYIRTTDRPLFTQYLNKYNIPAETAYTVVQKKHGSQEDGYIEYKVVKAEGQKTAKFVVQGFVYDPTPKSIIKISASKDKSVYEDLQTAYVMDKAGEYGYLYITANVPSEYEYVRVMFINKGVNTWNPLMSRAAFLK